MQNIVCSIPTWIKPVYVICIWAYIAQYEELILQYNALSEEREMSTRELVCSISPFQVRANITVRNIEDAKMS